MVLGICCVVVINVSEDPSIAEDEVFITKGITSRWDRDRRAYKETKRIADEPTRLFLDKLFTNGYRFFQLAYSNIDLLLDNVKGLTEEMRYEVTEV